MRQARTNANRRARAFAALAQQFGDGSTLIVRAHFSKGKYRWLFLILAGLIITSILLVFVRLPTSAAVKRRETRKDQSNSGLIVTPGPSTSREPDEATRRSLREAFGRVPLSFEANFGQTDAGVKFLCRGPGYTLFLTSSGAVFALSQSSERQLQSSERAAPATPDILRMQIVGANPTAQIAGLNQLAAHSNYFVGRNAAKWFPHVPNYGMVQYEEIYRGVDLVYYGNQRQLENDFIVAPAADPRTINLSFDGAQSISIDQDGALVLKTAGGRLQLRKPVAYQDVDGSRHEIAVKYQLRDAARSVVGFDVAAYDRSKQLIIDPVLVYSTYLGGNSQDNGFGIVVDAAGSAYVVGGTSSPNFPVVNSNQPRRGSRDVFITKFNPAGSALVYSTVLGGSTDGGSEYGFDIAVDGGGSAYVTGITQATDFPVLNAAQSTIGGGTGAQPDAFVTRLSPSGALAYSTYLGGANADNAQGIATDGAGNAYVTGIAGTGFPVTLNAFLSTGTGFISRLNTNASGASSLVYSSYLGGALTQGRAIAVDATGTVYVAGNTTATNLAMTGAAQVTFGGGAFDAFISKFNTNLSGTPSRIYSTYVGGNAFDRVGDVNSLSSSKAIAIDAGGNAYITGSTNSPNFPVANARQNTFGGNSDAFLTKLNAAGSAFVYSTYLGGTGDDQGRGVAVNVVGNAYVSGLAGSNFPTGASPFATGNIFVSKFTPDGTSFVYSMVMSNSDLGAESVGLDGAGNAFITGTTISALFPTASPFQATGGGGADSFVSEIADPTIIGRVVDEGNNPIPGATVNLTGVPSATTTTDANGYFTFGLLTVGNNYTVSVSVANYIFTSQGVNNLQKNVRLDFSPLVFTISGQVTNAGAGLSGVTMTLSDGKSLTALTNGSGSYSFTNLPAGRNYTVAPSLVGFLFAPTSRTITNLVANQTADFAVAFQATLNSWKFQGRSYIYAKLSFPDSGYSVTDWGTPAKTGNDFLVNATVTRLGGTPVQAVTTTAQIYDLGPLADGAYTFAFRSSGITVTTLAFNVSSAAPPPNPIDDAREFVKQQYRDFLNREADPAGEDFWTDNITKCMDPARRPPNQTIEQCTLRQRETTSGAFFLSPEFQYTGYFVYRMYQGALGRQPKLSEFTPDALFVGNGILVSGQLSGAKINQNKADYAAQFVNCVDATRYRCAEFKAIYDGLSNQQYVDKLFQTTGVNASAADRDALVNGLNGGTETRASVLRKVVDGIVVISEGNQQFTTTYGQAFYNSEFNRAFVQLEYFGYMKRDPDDAGYAFWLGKLNQFGGNFVNAEMVLAFISSPEYRARFGTP